MARRTSDWKLVHNGGLGANATQGPAEETLELFNIAEDPGEKSDLRSREPAVFAQLQEQLDAVRAAAVKPNIPPNRAPPGFEIPTVWGER